MNPYDKKEEYLARLELAQRCKRAEAALRRALDEASACLDELRIANNREKQAARLDTVRAVEHLVGRGAPSSAGVTPKDLAAFLSIGKATARARMQSCVRRALLVEVGERSDVFRPYVGRDAAEILRGSGGG